jgi:type III HopA1-like effector protein
VQADLLKWLEDVWSRRAELLAENQEPPNENQKSTRSRIIYIKGRGASAGMEENEGVGRVYDMYNARDASGVASSDSSHLDAMQRELTLLESAIQTPPEVQGKKFDYKTRGWMAGAKTKELSDKFFHYRKVQGAESVYRIYINAVPSARGKVFNGILNACGMWKVNGLHNAKLSSPDDGGRRDSIVIYLATSKAAEDALACMLDYHKQNPGEFNGALPKLVEPTTVGSYKMHGVGTAMEPPGIRLVSTGGEFYRRDVGQSFGAYRAELIFMALERTRLKVKDQTEQQRKAAFMSRVEKYFRRAGIDPDRPALQMSVDVDSLPSIETIQSWANTMDKTLL